MSLTKNINAYGDVATVLEAARQHDGAKMLFDSYADAIRWRQRAYFYRQLLFKEQGFTPYDSMRMHLIEFNGKTSVVMTFDVQQSGKLETLDGKEIDITKEVENPFLEEAMSLADQLKGKKK